MSQTSSSVRRWAKQARLVAHRRVSKCLALLTLGLCHSALTAALAFVAGVAVAAPALAPIAVHPLTPECGQGLVAVTWVSRDSVIVGGLDGVHRYSLTDKHCRTLVDGGTDGIERVMNVVSSGPLFYAFAFPTPQYAGDVNDGHALYQNKISGGFIFSDIALYGHTRYLLGHYSTDTSQTLPFPIVWRTSIPAHPKEHIKPEPVHFVQTAKALDAIRKSSPPHTGSLAVDGQGTLYVFTAVEPGVFRYRADGTALPPLATDLQELVIPRLADLFNLYRVDETARYRDLINKQPTVDDLVVTPDGPALVVRTVANEHVTWALWYPAEHGVRARVPLGMTRQGPFGHTRCDVREAVLVCVLGTPKNPASPELGPASLYLFHLPKLAGQGITHK